MVNTFIIGTTRDVLENEQNYWGHPPDSISALAYMERTIKNLDNSRLGKQRVEADQIIKLLEYYDQYGNMPETGWVNHPATRSWIGYTFALKFYFNLVVLEWVERGFENNYGLYDLEMDKFNVPICSFDGVTAIYNPESFDEYSLPFWVSYPPFYLSHQASLCRKNPQHYKFLLRDDLRFWLNNGYLWPCNITDQCLAKWSIDYHEDLACGCPPVYKYNVIDIFAWLKSPYTNPKTGRTLSKKSEIVKEYIKAMEGHGISVDGPLNTAQNVLMNGQLMCHRNNLDDQIRITIEYYNSVGGIPTADQLTFMFAGM